MEFFKHNTKVDFMKQRRWAAIVSLIVFMISLATLAINHLHWGLDFTGGIQLHLAFTSPTSATTIREALIQHQQQDIIVTNYGTAQDFLLTLPYAPTNVTSGEPTTNNTNLIQEHVIAPILTILPHAQVKEANYLGPQIGEELAMKGMLSVIIALLATMLYIAWRFEWRFAIGSTVALIHDPIIILGVFAYYQLEFNLISLAAMLTVIGYSLNDTIVIFDRIKEDFRRFPSRPAATVINQAINNTLSRTIMTSALTLTVVIALFVFGGQIVHNFALALMIGIIVGTYSSIYVAGSITLWLGIKAEHLLPRPKPILDDLP
jgi:preprotein translocase subunit SecF